MVIEIELPIEIKKQLARMGWPIEKIESEAELNAALLNLIEHSESQLRYYQRIERKDEDDLEDIEMHENYIKMAKKEMIN